MTRRELKFAVAQKRSKVKNFIEDSRRARPYVRAFLADASQSFEKRKKEFIEEVRVSAVKKWWAYHHPEVWGMPTGGGGLAGSATVDPFRAGGERADHIWTWKDAPDVMMTRLGEDGAVETVPVKPMGKVLLGG